MGAHLDTHCKPYAAPLRYLENVTRSLRRIELTLPWKPVVSQMVKEEMVIAEAPKEESTREVERTLREKRTRTSKEGELMLALSSTFCCQDRFERAFENALSFVNHYHFIEHAHHDLQAFRYSHVDSSTGNVRDIIDCHHREFDIAVLDKNRLWYHEWESYITQGSGSALRRDAGRNAGVEDGWWTIERSKDINPKVAVGLQDPLCAPPQPSTAGMFDFLWFGWQTAMGGSAPDDDDDETPEPAAVADARSRGKVYITDLPADIEPARRLLQRYSGIPARDVDEHILDISQRDKLWAIHPSVCVGHCRFLSMRFTSDPRYKDALSRLLVADSDIAFLDVGCCVGQVLRQLAFEGVDSSRLYGIDSEPRFLSAGYELFRDRDTLKATLVTGDLLASGEKGGGDDASRLLNGKMTIIHAMSFFHLFSWQAQTKTLAELSFEERLKTGLVRLGKRTTKIDGDQFGMLAVWAGNVSHQNDERMLMAQKVRESTEVEQLKTLLESVPKGSVLDTTKKFTDHDECTVIGDNNEETAVRFSVGLRNVCIMQGHDLDKDDQATYKNSTRAKSSEKHLSVLFPEPPMQSRLQRYLMAQEMKSADSSLPYDEKSRERYLRQLRTSAQEKYWTQLSRWEREALNRDSLAGKSLALYMEVLESNWPQSWDNGRFDRDYFRQFVRDHAAAEKLWPLVDEDVLVTDCKRWIVFASVEGLTQILPGRESKRHVVDDYIRKVHPELDISREKVEDLPKAKMAVAHYGCWASASDRNGRRTRRTRDTKLDRLIRSDDGDDVLDLIPDFYGAAFSTAAKVIQFLLEALGPDHYRKCREIFHNLSANRRMSLGDEDYSGARYFMVKQIAASRLWTRTTARAIGDAEVEDSDDPDKTCVNKADDEDEESFELPNKELHGAGALPSTSSSAGAEPEAESLRKTEESTIKA
ncbi:hypothetical protein DL766_004164 [Monosporascus sp. MC13-8B]|uniref:Methyltransferase domain-containing protein n=1 Tax=Monosporascus cannonballus TaxID=155416 RepID=A0ABY0H2L4_9PEZI|nr:hypothetical protein DL763_010228 [Monosporascus cannonballus]RYO83195.1 hypothetical protein DL762_006240 [Monosporascus cannonballus]RYP31977.1 hypothetical protein DL766_004164 [Monosporascus sp. MC13-8B]